MSYIYNQKIAKRLGIAMVALVSMALLMVACQGGGTKTTGVVTNDPGVSGFSPISGPSGTSVIIKGGGFSANDTANVVKFGSFTADTIIRAGRNTLETIVPEGAEEGRVEVTVIANGMTMTADSMFTIVKGAPGITSVDPDSGLVGDEITITGINFEPNAAGNTVSFGGTEATITSASETELVVTVPQGATDGPIQVTARNQIANSANDFDIITEGTIKAIVSTTGEDKDTNGYSISLDGQAAGSSTVSDTTFYFHDIEQGTHSLELSEIQLNCSVANNPRDVSVTPGDTTSTLFEVVCEKPPTGTVEVTTQTNGTNMDQNGYLVTVDGDFQTSVDLNETVQITEVPTGTFDVLLKDVAKNCILENHNPQEVTVSEDQTVSVNYEISCRVPNILPHNGHFELDEPMGSNGYQDHPLISVSEEQAHTGTQSKKVELPDPSAGPTIQTTHSGEYDQTFSIEAGKQYKLSAWFYIEKGLSAPPENPWKWQMSMRVQPVNGWDDTMKNFVALGGRPQGEWFKVESTFTGKDTPEAKLHLQWVSHDNADNTVVFMDDIRIEEVNP